MAAHSVATAVSSTTPATTSTNIVPIVDDLVGWSSDIADYVLIERVGRRTSTANTARGNWYGTMGAVYRARLTDGYKRGKKMRAECAGDVVVKIVYTFEGDDINMLMDQVELVFADINRLPRHPHVSTVLHYFSGYLPTPRPISWDAVMAQPHALLIVQELLSSFSLQTLISYRYHVAHGTAHQLITEHDRITRAPPKSPTDERPPTNICALRPEEVIKIAFDLTSAICHLHRHQVAHRDLKADNILFRLPTNMRHDRAMTDITVPGISVIIADFGCGYDFKDSFNEADGGLRMPCEKIGGVSRGGAGNTLAPEIIATKPGPRVFIDYDKTDLYSVGLMLKHAITGSHAKYRVVSYDPTQWPHDTPAALIDLIVRMTAALPTDRLSCFDAHARIKLMLTEMQKERVDSVHDVSFDEDIWNAIVNDADLVASDESKHSSAAISSSIAVLSPLHYQAAWTRPSVVPSAIVLCECHPAVLPPFPLLPDANDYTTKATDLIVDVSGEQLGRGSYAIVYSATCKLNGVPTIVAVKYMLSDPKNPIASALSTKAQLGRWSRDGILLYRGTDLDPHLEARYRRIPPHANMGWIRTIPERVPLPREIHESIARFSVAADGKRRYEPNLPTMQIIMEQYDCTLYEWIADRLEAAAIAAETITGKCVEEKKQDGNEPATTPSPSAPVITQAEVFHVARSMLHVLNHLWINGFSHRDIKPNAIMLQGEEIRNTRAIKQPNPSALVSSRVVLIDFGECYDAAVTSPSATSTPRAAVADVTTSSVAVSSPATAHAASSSSSSASSYQWRPKAADLVNPSPSSYHHKSDGSDGKSALSSPSRRYQGIGGNQWYMAPEGKTKDTTDCYNYEKADIYALGCTLLQMANATQANWASTFVYTAPSDNLEVLRDRIGSLATSTNPYPFTQSFIDLLASMVHESFDMRVSPHAAYEEIMNMCAACYNHVRPPSPNTSPTSNSAGRNTGSSSSTSSTTSP